MITITKSEGNGQAQCTRCRELNRWNMCWVSMMYEIEGRDGIYCSECVQELQSESLNDLNQAISDVNKERI